jgi:hypothetical protein
MRKKDVIEFDFGDSGKTAYFAVQIENDGKKGQWWPMVSALIPKNVLLYIRGKGGPMEQQ